MLHNQCIITDCKRFNAKSFSTHPMYAGFAPMAVGPALWLGSYVAALVAIVPIAVLALRSILEERFLKRELKGYEAYTEKVRYRLIPLVW